MGGLQPKVTPYTRSLKLRVILLCAGTCIPPVYCYAERGGDPIPGCKCHENCGSCGYSDDPTSSDNCIVCNPPLYFNPITLDGVGMCLVSPPGLGIFSAYITTFETPAFVLSGVLFVLMLGVLVNTALRRRHDRYVNRTLYKPVNRDDTPSYGATSATTTGGVSVLGDQKL